MIPALLAVLASSAPAASWPVPGDGPVGPWIATESGVEVLDVVVGTGGVAEDGATLEVHYVGMLEDGTVFDASAPRGETLSFRIGAHEVIRGWEEGAVGMRVGGTRRLVIPSHLGYGAEGSGPIPGGATLYFEVELVGLVAPRRPPAAPRPSEPDDFRAGVGGLRWLDLVVGAGDRPRRDERVCIDYTVWHAGKLVEHSFDTEGGRWIRYLHDEIVPGLEAGLKTMREGGVRQLVLGPELAYGAAGTAEVPPDATVLFEVSLIEAR